MRTARKVKSTRSSTELEHSTTSDLSPRRQRARRKARIKYTLIGITTILVLIGGVFVYQKINEEVEEITWTELGDATLPQISVIEGDYEVNTLSGYTKKMDILTMRDTISPLTAQGNLNILLTPYKNEIQEVSYHIYSSDGTMLLKEENVTQWSDNEVTLGLNNVIPDGEESLLELELVLEDGSSVYYYTRLITYGSCNLASNLNFVSEMHSEILAQSIVEESTEEDWDISAYLTSTDETSNDTLQYVTQDSSLSDVTWGSLLPSVVGEVSWSITECSDLFIGVLLEYQVEAVNDETGITDLYNVEEYYRVGYSSSESAVQLKQYARTVNQVFEITQTEIVDNTIDLGITSDTTIYKMNEEETAIAFVQERALYFYNGNENEISEIFTLEINEADDSRYQNKEYAINILSIDANGSFTFVVYGYMNCGTYEGEVGTSIYYYDVETNILVEKAFVASTTSFSVGEDNMSKGMYYSSTQNIIYMIAQGSFYEVNLTEDTQNQLAENMDESSYVISEDGKYITYTIDNKCVILEFETGDSYTITTAGESQIIPLGFIEHDLIYGVYTITDTLVDEMGSEITPMYQMVICSSEGEILKTYESENSFIRDISIRNNMITMNLVEEEDGIYAYMGQDIITNNEVVLTDNVAVTSYNTEQKQEQKKLEFTLVLETEIEGKLEVVDSQWSIGQDAIYISYESEEIEETYYAYAYGSLQLQSTMASDAIKYASENVGAVVNQNLEYVWRSGSRDLTFTVSNYSDYASRISSGESAIEIVAESASQNVVFYTGCTVEQMCYIINQGQVIAAKLEDDSWILLIGYTGETMYYLNENGAKSSISMSKLDVQVIELVGDGLF